MLQIAVPPHCPGEWDYIARVMLHEFLGVDYVLHREARTDVRIARAGHLGELRLPNCLLATPGSGWLHPKSLPRQPVRQWRLEPPLAPAAGAEPCLPMLYGEAGAAVLQPPVLRLPLDVFGSCFWLLTRYEEVACPVEGSHGRFPARAALAVREGWLHRPLVDEMAALLRRALEILWPDSVPPPPPFRIRATHDVDEPFELRPLHLGRAARRCAGELWRRHSPGQAWRVAANAARALAGLPFPDRCDTYDFAMAESESRGRTAAFYFICGHSPHDLRYEVTSGPVRAVIERILARGHEVGLHPSYDTFLNPGKLERELATLRQLLAELGAPAAALGGRQHYLRWRAPETWQHWEDAGLAYDSSAGFAEQCGFRCGTAREFPVYNLRTRRALRLRERPLALMDVTLSHPQYMNLDSADAAAAAHRLVDQAERWGGELVTLWHNDQLRHREQRDLFTSVMARQGAA
jgi:hypothetical protein